VRGGRWPPCGGEPTREGASSVVEENGQLTQEGLVVALPGVGPGGCWQQAPRLFHALVLHTDHGPKWILVRGGHAGTTQGAGPPTPSDPLGRRAGPTLSVLDKVLNRSRVLMGWSCRRTWMRLPVRPERDLVRYDSTLSSEPSVLSDARSSLPRLHAGSGSLLLPPHKGTAAPFGIRGSPVGPAIPGY
jgi:hypothetical protein